MKKILIWTIIFVIIAALFLSGCWMFINTLATEGIVAAVKPCIVPFIVALISIPRWKRYSQKD